MLVFRVYFEIILNIFYVSFFGGTQYIFTFMCAIFGPIRQ